jgi:MSHA biogenesis protein MshJ
MMEQVRAARIWFEGLSQRERFILIGAAAVIAVLLAELASWGPGRERLEAATTQLSSLKTQQSSLENELGQLDQSEALDPDAAARRQLDRLDAEIAGVDEKLRLNTLQILTPDQARSVLRDVIDNIQGIRFLGIRTEPPVTLVNTAPEDLPTLFRHGLVIDLEGEYLSMLDYTRALEALPWSFYWLGLEVDAYEPGPRRFRLHLYTVSLRKEWIGV